MKLAAEVTETENLFEILANKSPVGLYIVQDGKFCYINPTFQTATGYEEDELLGRNSLELTVPEDRERVRENSTKMLKGQPASLCQFRVSNKDGSIRWVMESVVSIEYHGRPATLGTFIDVTERKQAEEALRNSEEKLREMFESVSEGISIIDFKGTITDVNQRTVEMHGFSSKDELRGKSAFELITARDHEKIVANIKKAIKQGTIRGVECTLLRADGSEFPGELSTSVLKDASGNLVGHITIARNITEYKKAEKALRESEERFRSIVENSQAGIIILDNAYRCVYMNDELYRITGYSREEVIGQDFRQFLDEEIKELITERYIRRQQGEEVSPQYEFNIVKKDGQIRCAEISSAVIKDSAGKVNTVAQILDITERKQQEQALADELTRRRILVDQSRDGIVILDRNGKVYEANQRFAEMLGYTAEEVRDLYAWDWEYLYPRERVLEMIRTIGEAGDCFETQHRRKDGSIYDVQISTNGAIFADQKLIFCVCRDITERKKAEEALRDSEESYRELADSITDVFFAMDEHLRYTYWNKASETLTRIRAEDAIGKSLPEIFPDTPGIKKAEKVYRDVLRTQQSQTFVTDYTDPDGGQYIFEISAYPSRGGISVFVRDITDRKKMDEALNQAAEEWRKTFDSISDAISIHDRDFRIQRANKAFADIFNMQPHQVIGRYCYELHKGGKPISGCPHQQSLATGKPAAAEFYESHLGKYLHESTSPIFNDKGEVVGTVHITTDITEQKQQNEQLMMADRLASIGELSSGAAHELNNPLTSIIGFSQLLMEKDISDDIREDVKLIYNEAQRAVNITRNFLTFARKHTPVKEPNQINNIIEDVLELHAHEHKVNHIQVEKYLAPNLPEIMVDYFQMQQVFMNIIINAEYFMVEAHNGGTLTITTKKQNSKVRISIADDGPGIPPENLGMIFNPFFTTKEAGRGTGLGLSICHGIVNEHGGQIYARSQLGQGATIFIDLPIKSPTHFKSLL